MIPRQLGPRRRSSRQQQQQQQQAEEPRSGRYHHSHHHHHHHLHSSSQRRASRIQLDQPELVGTETGSSSSHQGDTVPCRTRLPFLLLRRRTDTDAHRVALEARGRLDERLREAALLGRRSGENSLPRLAQHYFNALFDDDNLLLEDEHELEIGLREWLAGGAPSFRGSSYPESWSEPPSTNRGLSKATVKALPREIYGHRKSKGREQVDCSVCLEAFSSGQILLCLPCEHKFHQACLTPWLDQHDQCPCCRAEISIRKLGLKPQSSSSQTTTAPASSNAEDNLLSWLEAFETGTVLSRTRLTS